MTSGPGDRMEVSVGGRSLRACVFEYIHGFLRILYVRLWLFWNEMEILFYPYRERLRRNPDTSFLIVAALILFFFKWKHLSVPFFWDEMGVYVEPLHNLYVQGARRLLNSNAFYNHPPGQQLLVWPLYIIFGESIFITRLFSLTCSIFAVYFTYRLGKEFYSRTLGIVASCTLFFMPGFFAQSDMYLGDTILTCLAAGYLYFAISGRFTGALIAGSIIGLTRESSIAFGSGVLLLVMLRRQLTSRWVLVALAPFLTFSFFLLMQKFQTGFFFNQQAVVEKDIHFVMSDLWPALLNCLRNNFGASYNGIMIKIFLISFPLLIIKRFISLTGSGFSWKLVLVFVFIISEYIVFFSFDRGVVPRYFYPAMPLYLVMALCPAIVVVGRLSVIGLPFLVWFFFGRYYGTIQTALGTGHEYSMEHMDVVEVFKNAAHYVEGVSSEDSVIFARWPLQHVVGAHYMGYVAKDMNVTSSPDDRFDIYMWTIHSAPKYVHEKEFLVRNKNLKLLKRFEHRGKQVEVYGRQGYIDKKNAVNDGT